MADHTRSVLLAVSRLSDSTILVRTVGSMVTRPLRMGKTPHCDSNIPRSFYGYENEAGRAIDAWWFDCGSITRREKT
jgi:hypothetical protein